jgi:hypothetical protein
MVNACVVVVVVVVVEVCHGCEEGKMFNNQEDNHLSAWFRWCTTIAGRMLHLPVDSSTARTETTADVNTAGEDLPLHALPASASVVCLLVEHALGTSPTVADN